MANNKPGLNQQPPAFKGSIGVDTKQTSYKPAKGIDYKNKTKEYNPPNKFYNVEFNAEKKKTQPVSKPVQPKPEPKPVPKPQSQPKPEPKPAAKPKPQAKPWPAAAKVIAQPKPVQPEPVPEPEPAPEPQPERMEWGEPVHQQPIAPIAAAAPVAIPIGAGLAVSLWPANRAPRHSDRSVSHGHHRGRVVYHGNSYLPSHNHGHGCPCAYCRDMARRQHHQYDQHHQHHHNHGRDPHYYYY